MLTKPTNCCFITKELEEFADIIFKRRETNGNWVLSSD